MTSWAFRSETPPRFGEGDHIEPEEIDQFPKLPEGQVTPARVELIGKEDLEMKSKVVNQRQGKTGRE